MPAGVHKVNVTFKNLPLFQSIYLFNYSGGMICIIDSNTNYSYLVRYKISG